MEKQGQASTGWVHLAVEQDFYPKSQGTIRASVRVTWDSVEVRICLELTCKEGLPDWLRDGKGKIWAVGLLSLSANLPGKAASWIGRIQNDLPTF